MNRTISILIIIFITWSCKKQVEVGPPITNPTSASVYVSDAKAAQVLTGIYGRLSSQHNVIQGNRGIAFNTGLSSDELVGYPQGGTAVLSLYTNSQNVGAVLSWQDLYTQIYVTNAAIEGIAASTGMSDSAKKQLTGEAKFMRAFFHFVLVNYFGDVPVVTTTDYQKNASLSRSPKEVVYGQIVADLKEAQQLLKTAFVLPDGKPTNDRVRPSKAAATAMLARVYLYLGDWANAETEATAVINDTRFSLPTLQTAFLKASPETIFSFMPASNNINSYDGSVFIRTGAPSLGEPVGLRPQLLPVFENNDGRRQRWVDSITVASVKYYYPAKYRTKGAAGVAMNEYHVLIRLAEMYLVRAEARAQQNKVTESRNDLLAIRKRAGLADATLTANDKASLLVAIAKERQTELFAEGHRWFDLKRTGKVDEVMSVVTPQKGGTWNTNYQVYPIPTAEIDKNPNLVQNPGY